MNQKTQNKKNLNGLVVNKMKIAHMSGNGSVNFLKPFKGNITQFSGIKVLPSKFTTRTENVKFSDSASFHSTQHQLPKKFTTQNTIHS